MRRTQDRDESSQIELCTALPAQNPGAWGATIARATIEAILGQRPVMQLTRHYAADAFSRVLQQISDRHQSTTRQGVRVQHSRFEVYDRRAEVAVTVHDGIRNRAVSVTMMARSGRWVVTGLWIGW